MFMIWIIIFLRVKWLRYQSGSEKNKENICCLWQCIATSYSPIMRPYHYAFFMLIIFFHIAMCYTSWLVWKQQDNDLIYFVTTLYQNITIVKAKFLRAVIKLRLSMKGFIEFVNFQP